MEGCLFPHCLLQKKEGGGHWVWEASDHSTAKAEGEKSTTYYLSFDDN